jgi:hypothetical protein
MPSTVVDRLYREYRELLACLDAAGEPSLRSAAEETFTKSLLLAAASYFEYRVCGHIVQFVSEYSHSDMVSNLVRTKAISRQYHTFFNWEGANANTFFSLFGTEFRSYMDRRVAADEYLRSAIRSFIELGGERNRLVHQDFGSYSLEKTAEEIYAAYTQGLLFVEALPDCLRGASGGLLVRIAAGGRSYHRAECSRAGGQSLATTAEDAARAGLRPCSICSPPTVITSTASTDA